MTWTVRALKWHTFKGTAYAEGEIYVVDEVDLLSLESNGFAHRVNPADNADPG